ncbi:MAG: restriction endonuclease [Prevotellaceae bacterium]|jgi:restriction system protein|nr:restriction endonuclease [Prevotellaceae bacterium]
MIPDFQTLMLPLLDSVKDKKEYRFNDIVDNLAGKFTLSEEEKKKLLPSGVDFVFRNRVGWAKTYLKKAGLLETPKRGFTYITQRGIDVLKQKPKTINLAFLKKFPEFLEFRSISTENISAEGASTQNNEQLKTPEEILDDTYQDIQKTLAQELLDKIQQLSPPSFERLVVDLLVKMGYGGSVKDAGKTTGKTGDEGIDGIIKEDKLGLDIIYIQAKKWQQGNTVGRPEIQRFVGALAGQGAKKGIFITTSSFTKEALSYIPRNETKIVLIDGLQLAQLMIDHNLGVTVQHTYEIKKVDMDYFEE